MFTFSIMLKQHTPIIHFQHPQAGATLRATEVKPKLDRFIIEQVTNLKGYEAVKAFGISTKRKIKTESGTADNPNLNEQWLSWLVGKGKAEHIALDYRIRIEPIGDPSNFIFSSNPVSDKMDGNRNQKARAKGAAYINRTQYFADNQYIDEAIGEWDNIRQGIFYDAVQVTIQCLFPSLTRIIEPLFKDFFCLQNFGTRQSKGFGCFLPNDYNDMQVKNALLKSAHITGVFRKEVRATFKDKLQIIGKDYSHLKMGRSSKVLPEKQYDKSKLWKYLCANDQISWEKRKIKLHLLLNDQDLFQRLMYESIPPKPLSPLEDDNEEDYDSQLRHKYIRALLGLAEQFEFLLSEGKNERLQVKVKDLLSFDNRDEYNGLAIDRFRSPIRFVITDESIYLVTYKIPLELVKYKDPETEELTFRKFMFTIPLMAASNSFSLTVPDNFDLPEFISLHANYGSNLKTIS